MQHGTEKASKIKTENFYKKRLPISWMIVSSFGNRVEKVQSGLKSEWWNQWQDQSLTEKSLEGWAAVTRKWVGFCKGEPS